MEMNGQAIADGKLWAYSGDSMARRSLGPQCPFIQIHIHVALLMLSNNMIYTGDEGTKHILEMRA